MITNGQPYITYEQLILLYRLCLVEKWFGLKFENGKIKATGMWEPVAGEPLLWQERLPLFYHNRRKKA